MTLAPYILVTGTTAESLVIEVQLKMELGYQPTGGPFHAGHFMPPHGGLAQAMVWNGPTAPVVTNLDKRGKR